MAAPSAKDCHTAISYYEKLYTDKYDRKPVVNRVTARWNFDSILRSMSLSECKALLEFYLRTMPEVHSHALPWFFNHYDKLMESEAETKAEEARRERLRKESEERAREWRARRGNQGTTDD